MTPECLELWVKRWVEFYHITRRLIEQHKSRATQEIRKEVFEGLIQREQDCPHTQNKRSTNGISNKVGLVNSIIEIVQIEPEMMESNVYVAEPFANN
eukprot:1389223-Ditylum_brightwellii.AAC.1